MVAAFCLPPTVFDCVVQDDQTRLRGWIVRLGQTRAHRNRQAAGSRWPPGSLKRIRILCSRICRPLGVGSPTGLITTTTETLKEIETPCPPCLRGEYLKRTQEFLICSGTTLASTCPTELVHCCQHRSE